MDWQIAALVRDLPNKALSYEKIGEGIGKSRSAVCSKVRRMGLAGRGKLRMQPVMRTKSTPVPPPGSDTERIMAEHAAEAAIRPLVTLADLEDDQCHFVVGDPSLH
jgi:hypothetical protein